MPVFPPGVGGQPSSDLRLRRSRHPRRASSSSSSSTSPGENRCAHERDVGARKPRDLLFPHSPEGVDTNVPDGM